MHFFSSTVPLPFSQELCFLFHGGNEINRARTAASLPTARPLHPTVSVSAYSMLPTKDAVNVHAPMWDLPVHPWWNINFSRLLNCFCKHLLSFFASSLSPSLLNHFNQHTNILECWKTKIQPPLIPYHSPASVHFSVCFYSNSQSHCSIAFSTIACCFCDTLSLYGFMIWLVLSALSHPPLSDPLPLSHFWILMCFRAQPQSHFTSYIHSWNDLIFLCPLGLNTNYACVYICMPRLYIQSWPFSWNPGVDIQLPVRYLYLDV